MATADGLALAALVFVLGLKHGFDPDHLVAIDGFARSAARARPRLSRWAGLFFSLGHGAVVTLVALGVALVAGDWQTPPWLEELGALVSIGVLSALGAVNVFLFWRTPAGVGVVPFGLRTRWLGARLAQASHPALIAAVGAAFALSFDTLSNVLLFSVAGGGALVALALGLLFTAGMVATDALNGLWVARMIARADARAAAASRWMSIAVAALCFAIAAGGMAKWLLPGLERAVTAYAPAISVATIGVIAAVAMLGFRTRKRTG